MMNRYTFTELSSVLMQIYYNYDDVPEYIKQSAEWFQLLEEIAVTNSLKEGLTNGN